MKVKKITMEMLMVAILMIACIIIFPNNVNAAVSYTRTIPSNDGSIELNLTGLNLSEEKSYSFALVTKGKKPETWHDITTFTKNTAKINLSSSTTDIKDVLKKTDTGCIYIKDNSAKEGTYILENFEVNLKLTLLQSIGYKKNDYYYFDSLYDSIGNNSNNVYYQFMKVRDKNFIEKYLEIKNSNGDMSTLESFLPSTPSSGYTKSKEWSASSPSTEYIGTNHYNDGLYLLWVKLTGEDTKEVYGCIIHDGLPDSTNIEDYIDYGTNVKEIKVISPKAGTYNAPQTVEILVRFDKKIKGSKVPTLKIKFGDSEERSLTNGTIKNDYYLTTENGVIIYSYNIQAGDEGQLAVVSLTGGNITDEKGNEAKISCPVLTGNTIKANTEGQVNNQTQNQDVTNTDKNDDKDTDKKPSTNNNQSTGTGSTGNSSSTGSGNSGTQNGSSTNGGSSSSNNGSTSNSGSSSSNKGTTSGSSNNGSTTNNKPSGTTTSNNNSNSKDDTTVKGKLPQTGVNEGVIAVIAVIAVIGVVMYVRYRKMKDIN